MVAQVRTIDSLMAAQTAATVPAPLTLQVSHSLAAEALRLLQARPALAVRVYMPDQPTSSWEPDAPMLGWEAAQEYADQSASDGDEFPIAFVVVDTFGRETRYRATLDRGHGPDVREVRHCEACEEYGHDVSRCPEVVEMHKDGES